MKGSMFSGMFSGLGALFGLGFCGWTGATKGSGRIVAQDRPVAAFHGIRLTGIGTVHLAQGPVHGVRVEADDNIVGAVTTEVKGGLLVIGLERSCTEATVRVHVTSPRIDELQISGAGEVVTDAPLSSEALKCRISGTGSMDLEGSVGHLVVEITGSGSLEGFKLSSSRCSVRLSGMGDCEVSVKDDLVARVSGMGRVVYDGNPPKVSKTVTGWGSIRARSRRDAG
jgi:hypothetical protein